MKKIILFDIDYTLSNRDFLRSFGRNYLAKLVGKTVEELNPLVDSLIEESNGKFGYFDNNYYAKRISEIFKKAELERQIKEMFFVKYPYQKALYPEAFEVLKKLKSYYILGIQSDGFKKFQFKKIEPVIDFFDKKYIFIFKDKVKEIYAEIERQKNKYIILDDKPEHINKLKRLGFNAVLVARGRYAEKYLKNPKKYPFIKEKIFSLKELIPMLIKS